MSEENIETIKRACEAWGQGDISIYRQMYAADATAYAGSLAPEVVGEMEGPEEIIGILESLLDTFEESQLLPREFIGEGDLIVVRLLMRGRPHGSSGWIEWPLSLVYRFRENLITYQGFYASHAEALEAAGLSE
jgi:hypothetical protein